MSSPLDGPQLTDEEGVRAYTFYEQVPKEGVEPPGDWEGFETTKEVEQAEAKEPRDWSGVREKTSNLLEIVGIFVVSYGFYLIQLWAGVISLGLGLILIGLTISRPPVREVAENVPETWQMGPT